MDTNPIPSQPIEPTDPAPSQPGTVFPAAGHTTGQVFSPTNQASPAATPDLIEPTQPVHAPEFNRPMPAFMNPGTIVGSSAPHPGSVAALQPKRRGRWSKKMFVLPLAVLVVLGGSAAAYFGYYVPNQPANIWSSALVNTGKGYDKISQYALSQYNSQAKGIKLNGSFKTSGLLAADGTIQGTNNGGNGEFTGSFSASGIKVDFDARLIQSSTGAPDVYFKVDGLQDLGSLLGGDSSFGTALNSLNGQWYFIDHTLFNEVTGSSSGLQINSSDISSILNAVGSAGKQNIFTSDPTKMAFMVKQNVGKETQDGRSVYHFKVAVNKQNLKSYVTTLCNNLKNSSLKKFFGGDSSSVSSSIGCDTASADINNMDASKTADAWVDLHTRLIHKIRFTENGGAGNYFDIGQDYQGGDSFPFMLDFQSKSDGDTSSGGLTLTLNTKTNSLTISGTAKDSSGVEGSLSLTVTPNNSPVKVEKPANSRTLIELLNDMGLGGIFTGSSDSIQSTAQDTQRKTDINALQGQLEAYQTENGFYPTLAEVNNSSWRAQNMQGLDNDALQDPDGTSPVLVDSPAADVYSYDVTPSGCDNVTTDCGDYTLTATLSDGTTYVKQALNADSTTTITN